MGGDPMVGVPRAFLFDPLTGVLYELSQKLLKERKQQETEAKEAAQKTKKAQNQAKKAQSTQMKADAKKADISNKEVKTAEAH